MTMISHFLTRRKIFFFRLLRGPWINTLEKYLLSEFYAVLFICLLASTGLFLVFDTFERFKLFLSKDTSFITAASYLLFKIPLILQLMIPIAALVATLISIGRLSQKSEITAMRSCGMSITSIARPILISSLLLSGVMFLNGEYLLPLATEKVERILEFDIKQKHLTGSFNRTNFWFREDNTFINIGLYDAPTKKIKGVTTLTFDNDFNFQRRVDAQEGDWHESAFIGWTLDEAIESGSLDPDSGGLQSFGRIPLVTSKTPDDLYNLQRSSETFSYKELKKYIRTLESEGVPVSKYKVDLASKISFPFVCTIASLVALSFGFTPARSGSLTISFVAGVSIGFGYYVTHAIFSSFAAAGFIPILLGAWSANILLGSIGLYLLGGAEFKY
jgi:lipopolysaccharide export system permease protein